MSKNLKEVLKDSGVFLYSKDDQLPLVHARLLSDVDQYKKGFDDYFFITRISGGGKFCIYLQNGNGRPTIYETFSTLEEMRLVFDLSTQKQN